MSRKSVPFSVPEGAARPVGDRRGSREHAFIDAHSDEWVSDRNSGAKDAPTGAGPSLVLDLAAERTLMETAILCMLTPMALGCFWLLNAMSGRARF
jgi:hypothetical protein